MAKQQICIGHLTNDDIWQLEKEIKYKNQMGGACLYSALGAAIWEQEVIMISYIGENYNRKKFYRETENKGINVQFVKRKAGKGIRIIIEYDENGKRRFVPKRKSGNYTDWAPKAADISQEILGEKGVVHIAPLPLNIQLTILDKVYGQNKIITLDPDIIDIVPEKKEEWRKLFAKIDYLLISEIELKKFFQWNKKWKIDNEVDIKSFCRKFLVKNIIIKKAEKGAMGIDKNGNICNIKAYPAHVVDCTGAGDAFAGGFGYGIQISENLKEAMFYGCVSSSFAIEGIGTSRFYEVNNILAKERYKKMKEI